MRPESETASTTGHTRARLRAMLNCGLTTITRSLVPVSSSSSRIGPELKVAKLGRCWARHRSPRRQPLSHKVLSVCVSRVCVCVRVCVRAHQQLKEVASSNPLYSGGYIQLRTDHLCKTLSTRSRGCSRVLQSSPAPILHISTSEEELFVLNHKVFCLERRGWSQCHSQ